MPKMKTKKAVAKRFKVTATGKLKHSQPGKRHILTKKNSKRKRQLGRPAILAEGLARTYRTLMCVA